MSDLDVSAVMQIAKRPDLLFEKGEGSWIWDTNGEKYLDFVQGWAVNTLGHSPDLIVDTLIKQAKKLINPSPAFYNQQMINCSNKLVENSVFDQVFFANSGAEANEGAIKLARKWGQLKKSGAWKIISFEGGFHGRTLTTMSASGKTAFEPLFEPKTDGFIKVPYNDIEAVENTIDNQTVAIMLELIQGEAGVIPADPGFVKGLRALADKHKLLLIVDEIQTGIARTGRLFAYE
ncbi:MAG TPA: aminotransferase class III-fold pyridoxal phosphate-dependent enzyme, partial [Leucothrix sp.]|nr:aminotransferase class III-fold pyridoxal phosphate-dependent enzyme [Leucothrix sp.]